MKMFALFAMLICAGILSFGCSEKKKDTTKDATKTETTEGGQKAADTPAEPAK